MRGGLGSIAWSNGASSVGPLSHRSRGHWWLGVVRGGRLKTHQWGSVLEPTPSPPSLPLPTPPPAPRGSWVPASDLCLRHLGSQRQATCLSPGRLAPAAGLPDRCGTAMHTSVCVRVFAHVCLSACVCVSLCRHSCTCVQCVCVRRSTCVCVSVYVCVMRVCVSCVYV